MNKNFTNIGLIGFGHIGRVIFSKLMNNPNFHVKIILDIGDPKILKYLFENDPRIQSPNKLNDNYYHYENNKTRFIKGGTPAEIPWDLMNIDFVVNAFGQHQNYGDLTKHINAGVKKVFISTLPVDSIDKLATIN